MAVTINNRFIGGGAVWDLGGAAGTVDLTGWQYTDALSEDQGEIVDGMADLTAELGRQLQARQSPSWQFPPLWRSFIAAAERDAHLVPPHLLRSALQGTAAGGLLLSQPIAAAAVDLIAAGGLFAAGSSGGDGPSKQVSPLIKPPTPSASSEIAPLQETDLPSKTEAIQVLKEAGLVGEHGRLRDVNVDEALKLIELSASHGGLLSLFAHGGYSMPTEEDSVDAHPLFGRTQLAEFIFERKRIAENGNAIPALVPLYVQHLRKAANHLYILSWTGDVIGAVNSSTSPSLAYLYVILETLRDESADVISELLHHAPLADLNIVRDGIARKLGTDPSKWQEAADAHSERDSGMSIHLGGIAKWRGETERPALDLSHDIKLDGRTLPWADHPLFSGGASLDPPKLGGAAFLGEGFTSAELPGGLNIHWRYQLNTETQVPEIVFTGNDPAIAFVLQYLIAANGGTNVSGLEDDLLSSFSRAQHFVAHIADHSGHKRLANASGVFIRFNPITLMHEGVYTRAREHYWPGRDAPNVGFIKPE